MKISILVLSMVITISMHGQADFSGSWKLNAEKSQFNKVSESSAAAKLVVEQKAGIITFQRNDRPKETLKMDSSASIEVSDANSKTKVSMKATADKQSLIETRIYTYPEGQTGTLAAKKTRTWSLSSDKKTLTIQDLIVNIMDEIYDMVLVYERQ